MSDIRERFNATLQDERTDQGAVDVGVSAIVRLIAEGMWSYHEEIGCGHVKRDGGELAAHEGDQTDPSQKALEVGIILSTLCNYH